MFRKRIGLLIVVCLLFLATGLVLAQDAGGAVAGVSPRAGAQDVWLGTEIQIYFTRPMNRADVEARFSLTPAVAGDIVWAQDERGQDSMAFRPHDLLAPQTRYQARLEAGVRDAGGELVLPEAYAWSFTTSAGHETLTLGEGLPVQHLDPGGRKTVRLWAGYPRMRVDFALYTLPLADFLARYGKLQPWPAPEIDVAGLAQAATWSQSFDRAVAEDWTTSLPTVPPGLYVLTASHPADGQDELFVVLSEHVLALKQGPEAPVTAWALDLQDQTPVAGMTVTLYDGEGAALAQGSTGVDGRVRLDAGAGRAIMAVGERDGALTLAGLGSAWQSGGGWWWPWAEENSWWFGDPNRVYIYSDRPIYRPGQRVHFSSILRRHGGDGYEPITAGTTITATLFDSRHNQAGELPLLVDEFGTVQGSFNLAAEPPLGQYYLTLTVDDRQYNHYFQVEAYRKPEYAVAVSAGAPYAIAGDAIAVTVAADYFFGQPVADAAIALEIYRRDYFGWGQGTLVERREGRSDAQGRWTLSFDTPADLGHDATFIFRADVRDASGQSNRGEIAVPVHWNSLQLEVRTDRYGFDVGAAVDVRLQARRHDGGPVSGQLVNVAIWGGGWRNETLVAEQEATTGAGGNATATFDGLAQGWYRILATTVDDRGRRLEETRWLWVFDRSSNRWWYSSEEKLTIRADKDAYAPGDTAQLLIESQVRGTALLTIERGDVYEEQVLSLDDPVTLVELPVLEVYSPNVFATVHLFDASSEGDTWENAREGRLLVAQAELPVSAGSRRLHVTIRADAAQYLPGSRAQLDLSVSDVSGDPVLAQASLALVDEAIFALAADNNADIFDYFYQAMGNQVITFDSLAPRRYGWSRVVDEPGGPPSPTPTPGPQPPPEQAREDEENGIRQIFKDTAYWNAAIRTDANGHARVFVDLPDNLTTWRVIARAVTVDTRVGQAQSAILVTQEIIARPVLPRFAIVGDTLQVASVAQNFSGAPVSGTVSLDAPGLTVLDPGDRRVAVPDNAAAVARWTAVASEVGANPITCAFETPAGADAVQLPLPTQPFAVPERWSAAGQVETRAAVTFTLPYNAVHEASDLTLRLSPSLALGLLDGLDALIDYPYGCVEQTMSRVLPTVAAAQAYDVLGIPNPRTAELPEIIGQSLSKLYSFQHDDGGWGWWYDDENDLYLTAYVLFGLTLIEQAGFEVSPDVLTRGFAHLDGQLTITLDPRIAAYAQYVKSTAGRGDLAAARDLAREPGRLDSFALAALALTLQAEGDAAGAQRLGDSLIDRAVQTPATAHWPAENTRDRYHWRAMSSAEKNTAQALRALIAFYPDHPLIPKAVLWLMQHRRGAGWRETQATAFAVLGLSEYILAAGELAADYDYTVFLNDEILTTGSVSPATVAEPIPPLIVPGAGLQSGENHLEISRTGPAGQLYYALLLKQALFFDSFQAVQSAEQGLALSRRYRTSRADEPDRSAADSLTVAVGDVVEVKLLLELKDEAWYILLEDPIPAGFEVVAERVNPVGYGGWCGFEGPCWPGLWRDWGYNRKEIHDDHVTFFFTTLWPGQHRLTYRMRAITPGRFSVLPAQAYAMYADEPWGRSSSLQVDVAPETLAARAALAGDLDRNCRLGEFDLRLAAGVWRSGSEGDVDGDADTDLYDLAAIAARDQADCLTDAPLPGKSEAQARLLAAAAGPATLGRRLAIAITAEGLEPGGGFALTLRYDPARLRFSHVEWPADLATALRLGPEANSAAGEISLGALALPAGYEAGDVLASLTFTPLSLGPAPLELTSPQAVDGAGRSLQMIAGAPVPIEIGGSEQFLPLFLRLAS